MAVYLLGAFFLLYSPSYPRRDGRRRRRRKSPVAFHRHSRRHDRGQSAVCGAGGKAAAGALHRHHLPILRRQSVDFCRCFSIWRRREQNIWVGRLFFIWTSVFNLFVVSVFWALMVDVFDSEQGKRLFGFIAAGATLGGIAGSSITASLAKQVSGDLSSVGVGDASGSGGIQRAAIVAVVRCLAANGRQRAAERRSSAARCLPA